MSDQHSRGAAARRPMPPPTPRPAPQPRRRIEPGTRRPRPGVVVVVVVAVFAGLLLAHRALHTHGAATRARPAATAARLPLSVGVTSCLFVDASRSTEDYVTGVSSPGRRLLTDIYYPTRYGLPGRSATAGAVPAAGPFPTIVFASGYRVDPPSYSALLDRWVRAGLVVIAPLFPDANAAAVAASGVEFADEADVPNQPGDVAFVTHQVLADSAGTASGCRVLHDLVAPSELGLAGQSDGATTVGMLEFDQGDVPGTTQTYQSLSNGVHYRAVALLSGARYSSDPYGASPGSPPVLVSQSATDTCSPPLDAVDLYAALAGTRRWFLAIRRAEHLTPYEGQDVAAFDVVARVSTEFFTSELRGTALPTTFLASGNSAPGVATFTAGGNVPTWMNVAVTQSAAACYRT